MKFKTVKQYQCDFCGKKNYSASHMSEHEKHCTMNPNRDCRMCKLSGEQQPKMDDMLALLPDPKPFELSEIDDVTLEESEYFYGQGLYDAVDAALPGLREITNGCPMCIMAAIRQKGIPVPIAKNFHFKEEKSQYFGDHKPEPDYSGWY